MKTIQYNGSNKVIKKIVELLNEKVATEDYPFSIVDGKTCITFEEAQNGNSN